MRNGRSWSGRAEDDTLYGAYYCWGEDVVVWGSPAGGDINKQKPTWTVRIGTATSPLRTVAVTTAYVAAPAA